MEVRVVHLTEVIDHLLEEITAILEVVEFEFSVADVQNEVQHIFLTLKRAKAVHSIECILLKEDEVQKF